MNNRYLLPLIAALAVSGCSKKPESTSATPPPPPVKARRQPLPTPVAPDLSTPPVVTETPAHPLVSDIPQYLKLDTDRRADAINDVGRQVGKNQIAPPTAAKLLDKYFQSEPDTGLRVAILDQLGWIEHPYVLDTVLSAFSTTQPDSVRAAATDAADTLLTRLGENKTATSYENITRALDPHYPTEVRRAAITALEDLDDKRAISALKRYTEDSDPEVRELAKDAIEILKQ